jgi:hypothetical protein
MGTACTEAGYTIERAVTAVNISEQRIAAGISVFIVISRFGTDAGDYCRSKAYHWEKPNSPQTSISDRS